MSAAMSTTYDTVMLVPLAIGNRTLNAEVSDERRMRISSGSTGVNVARGRSSPKVAAAEHDDGDDVPARADGQIAEQYGSSIPGEGLPARPGRARFVKSVNGSPPYNHSMKRRWWALVVACVAAAATTYALTAAPAGPRSLRAFDPDRTAALELDMWQAYYAKERVRLFRLLVTLLREQYHYPWSTAAIEGFHLARAAATFGDATSQYETVLPDLEKGYATARQWLGAGFDPGRVARAELAWWVARRTKGAERPRERRTPDRRGVCAAVRGAVRRHVETGAAARGSGGDARCASRRAGLADDRGAADRVVSPAAREPLQSRGRLNGAGLKSCATRPARDALR